jgi:hypothetical protein
VDEGSEPEPDVLGVEGVERPEEAPPPEEPDSGLEPGDVDPEVVPEPAVEPVEPPVEPVEPPVEPVELELVPVDPEDVTPYFRSACIYLGSGKNSHPSDTCYFTGKS